MTERRRPSDAALERALGDLAEQLAFPPTPLLASRVRARLDAAAARPAARRPLRLPLPRGLAAALVLIAALTAALLLLSPAARKAVADRLGLRGVRIAPVATLPPVPSPAGIPPGRTGTPATGATPAPPGSGLQLGEPVTLAAARRGVAFDVLVPATPGLGDPDAVYLNAYMPRGGAVALVYGPRPGLPAAAAGGVGLLLTEFRGGIEPAFFGKAIEPGTTLTPATVNGGRGWWIEGKLHVLFYKDANGQIHDDTVRLAGNTLIWEQGDLILRLEGGLSLAEALRIAETVR